MDLIGLNEGHERPPSLGDPLLGGCVGLPDVAVPCPEDAESLCEAILLTGVPALRERDRQIACVPRDLSEGDRLFGEHLRVPHSVLGDIEG